MVWTLTDGTLTIQGDGIMNDYLEVSDVPWYDYRLEITKVILEYGVKTIGYNAFHDCSNMIEIVIPDGVTKIEDGAFENCTGLESITIPDSVTEIGNKAFMNCSSLKNVTIPEGVTVIENSTFQGCSNLESVTIPDSVTEIGQNAFWNCTSLESVTIPDSVTEIGQSAFLNCTSLESVAIPDGVTRIEDCAYMCCFSLKSISIPATVEKMYTSFIEFCDNLQDIWYDGTQEMWEKISQNLQMNSNPTIHFGHAVTIKDIAGGTVKAKPDMAASGRNVKLTVKTEEGFALDTISGTYLDEFGYSNPLNLEQDEKNSSLWFFTMPDAEVSIEPVFSRLHGAYLDEDGMHVIQSSDVTVLNGETQWEAGWYCNFFLLLQIRYCFQRVWLTLFTEMIQLRHSRCPKPC